MKNYLFSSLLIFVGITSSLTVKAETKIAIVDMQKVVQGSSAGKKAKSILEEEFNKRKKDLEKKETELKKLNDETEKKKAVMSEEALRKRQSEFQNEMISYREMVNRSQNEMNKRQSELTAPIIEKISRVLDRLMKEKGFDLILENNPGILKSATALNITEEVLKEVEKEK